MYEIYIFTWFSHFPTRFLIGRWMPSWFNDLKASWVGFDPLTRSIRAIANTDRKERKKG